ncbi:D-alanyl-D-alanine carboxypeptidase family protein [Pseudonocardia phyllosphaerae]|uniref:D-alanyl-D-alanine carboxypeptidase family protein n=1 Tax=Pseudonocardia phyllosphaerae TaxID=3390502 RepID=UPI00397B3725
MRFPCGVPVHGRAISRSAAAAALLVAGMLVAGAGPAAATSARPAAATSARPTAVAGCPGQAAPPGPPAREETVAVAPLPVPDPPVSGLATCRDAHAGTAPPPQVGAASYVVADLDSGEVLAARAPHARERPASTIKLLLALLVAERLPANEVVTVVQADVDVDGSRAGIGPGGRYTVAQLLQGLLLASGNDCANALARRLGGAPTTVAAMRDEAVRLGALDTRPATPSGLDGPGMSVSAHDLAVIYRAAIAEPRIATVLRTRNVPFPGFGAHPGFVLGNDDKLLGTPGFLGGKNGFTDAARHTFVGGMQRGGRRLVVSLVRGETHPVRMVDQAKALLGWGFGVRAGGIGTLPAAEPEQDAGPDASAAPGGVPGSGAPGVGPGADSPTATEAGGPDADAGPSGSSTAVVAAGGGAVLAAAAIIGVLEVRRRQRRR